ncbi:MAG: hypothetical protein J7J87_00020 [Candidatus Diapherotrites archaeon]|nr:hypothetical protein [Candidatus Diapherotrites archaeon]
MKKAFAVVITLLLTIFYPLVCAQETTVEDGYDGAALIDIGVGGTNIEATGVNCFDYYRFGSIKFQFPHATKKTYNAGETANIIAVIKNTNPYPVVQGNVWAQVYLINEESGSRQGSYMIDEFLVMEDLYLDTNQEYPLSFEWYIPENSPSGEYYVALFFQEARTFNLAGLPFVNHVYGAVARFNVKSSYEKQIFYIDRNSVLLNGDHVILRHFAKEFEPGEKINYEVRIINTTPEPLSAFVEYELYRWDSSREENLLREYSKKRFVDIDANSDEIIKISFTDLKPAAYLLKIKASANGWSNILNLRFSVRGSMGRFIFSGIDKFPLVKGDRFTLFSCFSNSTDWFTEFEGKATAELVTADGKLLGKAEYEGIITPKIIAMKKEIEADEHYDKLYLISKIMDKEGNLHQKVTIVYDLSKARSAELIENYEKEKEKIDTAETPAPATPKETQTPKPSPKPEPKQDYTGIIIAIIVLLAILFAFIYLKKKNR